jgi:hypothetical protein
VDQEIGVWVERMGVNFVTLETFVRASMYLIVHALNVDQAIEQNLSEDLG